MDSNHILKNKTFLYLTEFFSGMSVMAVELGASRLLAPYFSSSQIVWTIIIGTIMIAMALGNLYGGKTSDKNPDPDRLYKRIMISAVWISIIPFAGKYVIVGVTALLTLFIDSNFLVIAAFITCMILFVFPLLLLGTVTPSLVKYTVSNLSENGQIVGRLGALNTIGSIIGTFIPTFVTIPAVGTNATFLIFSAILFILCLVYFLYNRKKKLMCAVSSLIFVVFSGLGARSHFAFWEDDLLYEGESIYNYLQVKESPSEYILSTNVLFGVQSVKMKAEGLTGMYYDTALFAVPLSGVPEDGALDALILGMGSGTYAGLLEYYYPDSSIEGVEIDERITKLAYDYFEMSDKVNVKTDDGRAYLKDSKKKYDVIMIDAYQDITIPFQMSSVEFFDIVKSHLKEKGVMVVNMNMYSRRENSIDEWLSDTISSVFDNVYTADVPYSSNKELFAFGKGFDITDAKSMVNNIEDTNLKEMMETVYEEVAPYKGKNRILTDDRAPVEVLGMRVIDDLIKDELTYYRKVYEEDGLKGLLDSF